MASSSVFPSDEEVVEEKRRIFVSGVSGYIGGHIVRRLLLHGFLVNGTVRNPGDDARKKYDYLFQFESKKNQLTLFPADLTKDDGWHEAAKGCDLAIHTANVMPGSKTADGRVPVTEEDFCIPAKEGMLRVLNACKDAGTIQKVVYLSSIGAMNWELWDKNAKPEGDVVVSTGADWTPLDGTYVPPYIKSKTLAERTFWKFLRENDNPFEGATCHPTLVIGPVLQPRKPDSMTLIQILLDAEYPLNFNIHWSIVDVRDVASAVHLALLSPESTGNRYMLSGDGLFQKDIASLLHDKYYDKGYNVPRAVGPSIIPKTVALMDPLIRDFVVPILDVVRFVDVSPSRKDLGLIYTPSYHTILQAAESMIEYKLVKPPVSGVRRFVTGAAIAIGKLAMLGLLVNGFRDAGYMDTKDKQGIAFSAVSGLVVAYCVLNILRG